MLQIHQQYDFDIQHRPGRWHSNADALSPVPHSLCECRHYGLHNSAELASRISADNFRSPHVVAAVGQNCPSNAPETTAALYIVSFPTISATTGATSILTDDQRQYAILGVVIEWRKTGKSPTCLVLLFNCWITGRSGPLLSCITLFFTATMNQTLDGCSLDSW